MRTVSAARVIAIVEDDASLRRSISNFLTSAGYETQTFEDAKAFLASPTREQNGCVLLDLQMPGMSGLQLLHQLRAEGSTVPLIVLTAHAEHRQRALESGASAFLTKPFRADALLAAIESAFTRAP